MIRTTPITSCKILIFQIVAFIAFCLGFFCAFGSLATVHWYSDSYSNGNLSVVSTALYVVAALLTFPVFIIAVFSLIGQLACKKIYEAKTKMVCQLSSQNY